MMLERANKVSEQRKQRRHLTIQQIYNINDSTIFRYNPVPTFQLFHLK
jgi:hypothetical protein